MPNVGLRRHEIGWIYGGLAAANLAAWTGTFLAFGHRPALFPVAVLAYVFGLRHAFDADHIAAIDNVTRKLLQEGGQPTAVGLFFALGHSTVVVAISVLVAVSAGRIGSSFAGLSGIGDVVGTSVSGLFLVILAAINIVVLCEVWRLFRAARAGGLEETVLRDILDRRGVISRLLRPLFRLVRASWHMYPVGMLFGLGFDTATEIGLLGISAMAATKGLPLSSILIFPALFAAGMSLGDTTDGVLMVGAYGWAFKKPIRKLWYNLTTTFLSVVVALVVGGVELLGLIGERFGYGGPFWRGVDALDADPSRLGVLIVAIFAASWFVSAAIYKWKGFDGGGTV